MVWKVLGTILCPNTGIAYSGLKGLRHLKLIIWYEADIYMAPDDVITPFSSGVLINDTYHDITVYNVTPYSDSFWEELKEKLACPFNKDRGREICNYNLHCQVKCCPYGFSAAL
ncbi:anti-adapter protein IraM [Intestinirhabdus alba]|jgi:hypothetical protein|uniref:Anti-adapter protein IraM n=1 Tax=Intestinirhabdus alba TaxID=2899544 RepID=A0A6L6IML0_9ENTR|nr:anti-adapter protein IraM [Intestinirhabdus alba]MTH47117.1 anti-adapter protein IraM [Intestinirhabdus alba]